MAYNSSFLCIFAEENIENPQIRNRPHKMTQRSKR